MKGKCNNAVETLNRTIAFVSNCDNKASIILAVLGVIVTVILSSGDMSLVYSKVIDSEGGLSIYFLILFSAFLIFACIILYGTWQLVLVLTAKIDCDEYKQVEMDMNSLIFFDHICQKNTYAQYKDRFSNMTDEEYLNDILSQIYINSIIVRNKYRRYSTGLRFSMIGILGFSILFIVVNC